MAKVCKWEEGCCWPVFSRGYCQKHWKILFGKPLNRFKPLTQTSDGKTAKVFRIKPVSYKLAKKRREYKPLRDQHLIDNPFCQLQILCKGAPATEVHHVKPREFFLCDTTVFRSACRLCHDWIPTHDAEARERGFLLSKHI